MNRRGFPPVMKHPGALASIPMRSSGCSPNHHDMRERILFSYALPGRERLGRIRYSLLNASTVLMLPGPASMSFPYVVLHSCDRPCERGSEVQA